MDYWEMRTAVSKILPRRTQILFQKEGKGFVQEKGRKVNYHEYHITEQRWNEKKRTLNQDQYNNFIEVSCRAASCPMPLNVDLWDGLYCGFQCKYCFADSFRSSLYTSFFDDVKSMGYRKCSPDFFKPELAKLLDHRFEPIKPNDSEIQRAVKIGIPMRLGIRFENFLPSEKKHGISLALLNYLKDEKYPVMVNSKSDLLGTEPYVRALADNPAGSAVHITLISSDPEILKKMEPGAPNYEKRIATMKALNDAGIRVVARIEPYMVFINDEPEKVSEYIRDIKSAGVKHLTFDTYSYSALNPGIKNNFVQRGWDFERMFRLCAESQAIGSLLLEKFMDLFREEGLSCSTFDQGSASKNDDDICCCEVGDLFPTGEFNHGSIVSATNFIKRRKGRKTTWKNYEKWVEKKGGFLSDDLKLEIKKRWSAEGHAAYSLCWASGMVPVGSDSDGIVWKYNPDDDFRIPILEGIQ